MPASSQESAARRYRIEKYLTEGGMGAIYIGKKLGPGGFAKEVVLKQLLPEYTSRPEFRDLFFREAKISATLDHANIVHTFDLVESDQSLFIVMEYVRGADLRTIIRRARQRKRELSPAAAIHITLEILAGLAYAHARRDATGKSLNIIHRDVSPSNIICSVEGAAKLSDFGIAKASTYSSVFYRVRGKVGYMSPEQARSQAIDHRCDLFSLSVCLYESLSGERLFIGDLNTPADEIYGIRIVPVSHKRPGLPPALDDVLLRALAPNVDDRYQSAAELAEALRTVAHRTGMTFSAPELSAHLRSILGDDPERWLRDEPTAAMIDPVPPPPPGGSELVGTEAESIGIVSDIADDEPGRSVLSPRGVSGSKDFDLDSMLNDEATRPGGEQDESAAGTGDGGGHVGDPGSGTPPPVWTRDSRPFGVAVPGVSTPGARDTVAGSTSREAAAVGARSPLSAPVALPGIPPAPPVVPAGRRLPRATIRSAAVPPPFQPVPRLAAPPPPPPFPLDKGAGRAVLAEIEEPTPPRPATREAPQPSSFDIEDAVTPRPAAARLAAIGGGNFRGSPPAAYPVQVAEPAAAAPQSLPAASSGSHPLLLNKPQTLDFNDAVNVFLPEKKSGPPGWLTITAILAALVGGAALAHRVTRTQVALALSDPFAVAPRSGGEPSPAHQPGAAASAAPSPAKIDDTSGTAIVPGAPVGASSAKGTPGRPAPRSNDDEVVRSLDAPPPAVAKDEPSEATKAPTGSAARPKAVASPASKATKSKAKTKPRSVKPSAKRRGSKR